MPQANAICERLVGTLRPELLDRMLICNQVHLHAMLAEYQVPTRRRRNPAQLNCMPSRLA
jgi:hypothetical protein